jgi:hypothetical protein
MGCFMSDDDFFSLQRQAEPWLKPVLERIGQAAGMLKVKDNILVRPTDISAVIADGHFGPNSRDGSIDLTLALQSGGTVEAKSLSREDFEKFAADYIKSAQTVATNRRTSYRT